MSGWDHDFLIQADPRWVVGRFVRRLRQKWPALVVGVDLELLAPPGKVPARFPEFVDISRDRALQEWTYRKGAVSDENGESSIGLLQFPKSGGRTAVDLITAEPRPHPFTEMVIGVFAAALADWYLRRPRREFQIEAPADPAWMRSATAVCARKRCPTHELREVDDALELRAPGDLLRATYTFGPARDGPAGGRFSATAPPGADPAWREEIRAPLREALASWHLVSFRSMRPRVVYTWPPGVPVLKGSLLTFEGQGRLCHDFDEPVKGGR